MLTLILLLGFSSLIAFLSIQNTTPVTIVFLNYTLPATPLYYIIIGSMLIGILLAYGIHLVQSISSSITIRGKNKKIKGKNKQLTELTKEVHQLQIENATIKKDNNSGYVDKKSM